MLEAQAEARKVWISNTDGNRESVGGTKWTKFDDTPSYLWLKWNCFPSARNERRHQYEYHFAVKC